MIFTALLTVILSPAPGTEAAEHHAIGRARAETSAENPAESLASKFHGPLVDQAEDGASPDSPIQAALDASDATLAALIAVPAPERTVANTLLAIDDAMAQLTEAARMTSFMAEVAPGAEERATGRRAQQDISNWYSRLAKNEQIFQAVQELGALEPEMTPEQRRFYENTLRDFRRGGFDLSEQARARLAAVDEEINQLGSDFRRNVADDETLVFFTEEELGGLPETFTGAMKRSGDLFQVSMKGSNLAWVLGYCDVEASREKMGMAASMRGGAENVRVLEKLLLLRHERATLLGYPNAAAYALETKMARTPETVMAFFDDLAPRVRKKAAADFAEFEAAKREATGDPEAVLKATDVAFYTNYLKREKYAVDSRRVREYFPMEAVTEGMFGVYQELFDITFRDITETAKDTRPLWHGDVQLFEVTDNATDKFLGEFYLDLFPREGKYTRASHFPLRQRKEWSDGRISPPLVALVCNFTKPTEELPSLMSHRDVRTYFHEFGHCLHSILTEATIANFAGTSVPRDFVEAPSQMLENWVWQPEILSRFAKHYQTGEPLPLETIEGMVAAKNLGAGFNNEGQVYLGMMDLRFHMDDDGVVDSTKVCEDAYNEARVFTAASNLKRQASFTHVVGYEAGYYGYLWSSVYAQDMWSRFAKDPMNKEVAAEYRRTVLAPGGGQNSLDAVRSFLGREPNAEAFLKHLGLD